MGGNTQLCFMNGVLFVPACTQVTAVNAVEDDELKAVNEKEADELENRLKAAGVPFER